MHMGREREIQRWEIHDALLAEAIARAEAELAALPPDEAGRTEPERERARTLFDQIEDLRLRRHALGPSPKAKMG
jgi:hypothetical protein